MRYLERNRDHLICKYILFNFDHQNSTCERFDGRFWWYQKESSDCISNFYNSLLVGVNRKTFTVFTIVFVMIH